MSGFRRARVRRHGAQRRIHSTLLIGGLAICASVLTGAPSAATPIAHHARSEILARGTTAAGTSYTIAAEKRSERFCRASIAIAEHAPDGQFESASCFTGSGAEKLSITCPGDRVAIEALVPAVTREIRLRLADGRTLTSRVTRIPARDGGPLGVYFQAVAASEPRPVSLIELDAHGRKLGRMHDVQSHSSCKSSATREEPVSTGPQS
ncbi:MAG TPA: hypothetical protein VN817_08950 [Solirubrobacteraceae bacterium]|nr:hypothetical protein [Solirubrobacteraceae bacterium]